MITIILFILSSVALSTWQVDVGPQTFPEKTSLSPLITDKHIAYNPGFKYFIAPIQSTNAQNIKPENQQSDPQHFEKQAFFPFINFSPSEEFQVQNRELQVPPQTFNKNDNPIYVNLQGLRFFKSPAEQKPRKQYQIVNIPHNKQLQNKFSPITQYFHEEQLKRDLIEQIRWKMNRVLENSQNKLMASSTVSEENKFRKEAKTEDSTPPSTNNQEDEQEEAGIKEVEDILSGQDKKQDTDEVEELNYEKSPFFIHQQVTVTKHHPVDIIKQVKVAVPTPVLVPVPEPYEVKVPLAYHVPIEVIRHIPVPVGGAH